MKKPESTVFVRDTRDKIGKHDNVDNYLSSQGHKIVRTKMYVGDVTLLHNQTVCIDLKRDLMEVVGNLTQQHKRFKAECQKAKESGIRLIILVEHGKGIKTIEDVRSWENPRLNVSPYAVSGERLYKIMSTFAKTSGIEWFFCDKRSTGKVVESILLPDNT